MGEARLIAPGRRWAGFLAKGPFAESGFVVDRGRPGNSRGPAVEDWSA